MHLSLTSGYGSNLGIYCENSDTAEAATAIARAQCNKGGVISAPIDETNLEGWAVEFGIHIGILYNS